MQRILFAVLPALVFVFSACKGSADGKAPELASEMCKCFEPMQKGLSPTAQAFYKEVGNAAKPSAAFSNGLENMDTAEAEAIRAAFLSMDEEGSAVNRCIEAYDRKYEKETTRDKSGLLRKVLAEMRKNTACPIGAAVMNLGVESGNLDK